MQRDDRLPEVSVVMITYNHEVYIEAAVESVFAQNYGGRLRLIVGDDASTDGTADKLRELRQRSPIDMELILRTTNVGGLANLRDLWSRTTGSYIAILEGDDYWTRSDKLARQIARLEALPSATLAFSDAEILDETTSPPTQRAPVTKTLSNPQSEILLEENVLSTCTAVYRRGVVATFPDWLESCAIRDWPLHALHAAHGEIVYLNEVQAVHRLHSRGRWTAMEFTTQLQVIADIRETIWREIARPAPEVVRRLRARDLASLAAAAETRRSTAELLRKALEEDKVVAMHWLFLYAATRVVLGNSVARRTLKLAYRLKRFPEGLTP